MWTEIIGWSAAAILLLTISRQVYTQWRARSTQGLSKWLFTGQLAASTGFVVYSWLLGNWVFVVTNALMLVTAGGGQWIYLRNKRREERAAAADQSKRASGPRAQRLLTTSVQPPGEEPFTTQAPAGRLDIAP